MVGLFIGGVVIVMSETCGFKQAWTTSCSNSSPCPKHKDLKCSSCGEPATYECGETMYGFVCGAPLCDNCEHTIQSNGCNSGGELPDGYKSHCKKDEQVYKSWYMEDKAC